MRARRAAALGLLLTALLGAKGRAQIADPGLRLDIPADWAPVLCGGRLYVFSSNGRNQVMTPGDAAPMCDPVQFVPRVQPVCAKAGPLVLDREGVLWQLGEGFPKTVQEGLKDVVALLPTPDGPAYLFKDRLRIPGGAEAALPAEAAGATRLSDGGYWAWGAKGATRLDPQGNVLWRWTPKRGTPGPATLSAGTLFAGTSLGDLAALRDSDGKLRFAYRGGGAVTWAPAVSGDAVVFGSEDHFVRAVNVRSGQLVWQARAEGRPSFGPTPVDAGFLFAESSGHRLFILSPAKGRKVWEWRLPSGSLLRPPAVEGREAAVLAWGEEEVPTLYRVTLPTAPAPPKKGAAP